MNKIIFLLTIFCCVGLGNVAIAQSQEKVKAFLNDCANDNIDNETIIQKHICIDYGKLNSSEQEEMIDGIKEMLAAFRTELEKHSPPIVTTYSEVPRKYQTLQIKEEEKSNVYAFQVKGEDAPPGFILIKDGKIASFIAMSKGNDLRYFLLTCSLD